MPPPLTVITRLTGLIFVSTLTACGGGGSTTDPAPVVPNILPVATNDSASLTVNTPSVLNILANDTDSDGSLAGISVVSDPANGSVTNTTAGSITYTPNNDYTGQDSFSYAALDNRGGRSNTVTVSLTIDPITTTTLLIRSLSIPTTDYAALNNAELNASVLTSTNQPFTIPPNPVSMALYLTGSDVSNSNSDVLLTSLTDPSNMALANFTTQVSFCDTGFCASLLPRREDQLASTGNWAYTLGSRASDLTDIDFTDMRLQLAVRTGPTPDLQATQPASFKVQPFKTSTSITDTQLNAVLTQFVDIANSNGISVDLQPTNVLPQPQYAEVSSDFNNANTAELVTLGAADSINIFFIEGFTGAGGGGRLGISPGIPGTLGVKGPYNGVLINATSDTLDGPADFYARTTAEFAFHEIGHLLGLFHTTERDFKNDIIDDTPNCTLAANDTPVNDIVNNTVGVADVNECPDSLNPMFWTPSLNTPKRNLTAEQRRVIYYSPIAR